MVVALGKEDLLKLSSKWKSHEEKIDISNDYTNI